MLTFLQLISIAHRLQTVAYSDRIIILDAGQVVEVSYLSKLRPPSDHLQFDAPLALFDNPRSAFRGLCDKAVSPFFFGKYCSDVAQRIVRQDLVRIQQDAVAATSKGRR